MGKPLSARHLGDALNAVQGHAQAVCAAAGVALAVLVAGVTSRYGVEAGLGAAGAGAVVAHLLGRHCGHIGRLRALRRDRRC